MDRVSNAYRMMMEGTGIFAGALFLFNTVSISLDVLLRNTGIAVIPWAIEVSEYSMPLATFLAAPWVLYHSSHVRVEIVVNAMPPSLRHKFDVGTDVIGLLVCLGLIYIGVISMQESASSGAIIYKELVFPEWYQYIPMLVSGVLLSVEFLRRLYLSIFDRAD